MPTSLANHFEALRKRFPAESALLITNAQQSLEMMEATANDIDRSQECRCAHLDVAGISYLVWEMDEESDSFQVFATVYNISIGVLRLSTKPSGIIVVAGFYVDLGALATTIAAHFQTSRLPAEMNPPGKKKRKLLLFGFAESFGHHFWNEVSGLTSAMESGLFDSLDGIILGPFDYFNLGPLLHAKGKQVWKLKAIGSLVTPDQLIIYHNNVVTEEARHLVLTNAAAQESLPEAETTPLSICFQIRRHTRSWINEEDKLFEIITTCAREWPDAIFTIDGHSTSKGIVSVKEKEIGEEAAFTKRLAARLGGSVNLRSTIGMNINAKINILKNVDMFVGPIGSGGVLSSWLLRKPTILYGPTSYYRLVRDQEGTVPEGGSMSYPVPLKYITNIEDDTLSFDVEVDPILRLIRHVAEQRAEKVKNIAKSA